MVEETTTQEVLRTPYRTGGSRPLGVGTPPHPPSVTEVGLPDLCVSRTPPGSRGGVRSEETVPGQG